MRVCVLFVKEGRFSMYGKMQQPMWWVVMCVSYVEERAGSGCMGNRTADMVGGCVCVCVRVRHGRARMFGYVAGVDVCVCVYTYTVHTHTNI